MAMTQSIYESEKGLLHKILRHHAAQYRIIPDSAGGFDVDIRGHFSFLDINIKRIEEEYDCYLRQIFTPHICHCECDCTKEEKEENYIVFRFVENHPKLYKVKFECGHVQNFAQTYQIGIKEMCDWCDEMKKVSLENLKSIDQDILEANK